VTSATNVAPWEQGGWAEAADKEANRAIVAEFRETGGKVGGDDE